MVLVGSMATALLVIRTSLLASPLCCAVLCCAVPCCVMLDRLGADRHRQRRRPAMKMVEAPMKLEHSVNQIVQLLDTATRESHGGKYWSVDTDAELPW